MRFEEPLLFATTRGRPSASRSGSASAACSEIGHYRILGILGAGGMGLVYAAEDRKLGRTVAIKKLYRNCRTEVHDLVTKEARALASVSSAYVVQVYEVLEEDGNVYIVMQLVDGLDMRSYLRQSPRGWSEIVDLFIQAGKGLHAIHSVGLIHRDFKPDNVLVDKRGGAKIVDLGIAVRQESEALPDFLVGECEEFETTRSRLEWGSPRYMSPEQFQGKRLSPASDQFSFCVSLWEALTGDVPHGISDYVAAHRGETSFQLPAPRGSFGISWIEEVLKRGLRSDPADRFSSMEEIVAALNEGQETYQANVRAVAIARKRIRRRVSFAASLLALCGGVALGVDDRYSKEQRGLSFVSAVDHNEALMMSTHVSGPDRVSALDDLNRKLRAIDPDQVYDVEHLNEYLRLRHELAIGGSLGSLAASLEKFARRRFLDASVYPNWSKPPEWTRSRPSQKFAASSYPGETTKSVVGSRVNRAGRLLDELWVPMSQSVEATKLRGSKVVFSAWAKVANPSNTAGNIWIRADCSEQGRQSTFEEGRRNTIRSAEWGRYEVSLVVPDDCDTLSFGGIARGVGGVVFDEMSLNRLDAATGVYEAVQVSNGGFEAPLRGSWLIQGASENPGAYKVVPGRSGRAVELTVGDAKSKLIRSKSDDVDFSINPVLRVRLFRT